MIQCIDFDKHFEKYVTQWMGENEGVFKNFDEMEAQIPFVYEQFLDTPATWLEGDKPGEYFENFTDPDELIDLLVEYDANDISTPDMLLNRIAQVALPCQKRLCEIVENESASKSLRMTVISLLRELDSVLPLPIYVKWVATQNGESELCDGALESLQSMGEKAVQTLLAEVQQATEQGQINILSIIAGRVQDTQLTKLALHLLLTTQGQVAVLSDILGRLQDEKAIPTLEMLARSEETSYFDYIEIRNAIEMLGGEMPARTYDVEDEEYAYMRLQQDDNR